MAAPEPLQWLALGAAMADRRYASKAAAIDVLAFTGLAGMLHRLIVAGDREGVRTLLGSKLNVQELADHVGPTIEAVLEAVLERGRVERQQAVAERIRAAGKLMTADKFVAFLADQAEELAKATAVVARVESEAG